VPIQNLTCPHCKVEFIKEHQKQVFCSRMCSRNYKSAKDLQRIEKTCKTCSKPYQITTKGFKNSKIMGNCYACTREATKHEKRHQRQCLECGKDFRATINTVKLCSDACIELFKNKKTIKFKSEKQKPTVSIDKIPCASCAFGKASTYAELGWECTRNARVCSPFTFKTLFQEKGVVYGKT
jgi:hypothetical protein